MARNCPFRFNREPALTIGPETVRIALSGIQGARPARYFRSPAQVLNSMPRLRRRRDSGDDHHSLLDGLALVVGRRGSFRFSRDSESRTGSFNLEWLTYAASPPAARRAFSRRGGRARADIGSTG